GAIRYEAVPTAWPFWLTVNSPACAPAACTPLKHNITPAQLTIHPRVLIIAFLDTEPPSRLRPIPIPLPDRASLRLAQLVAPLVTAPLQQPVGAIRTPRPRKVIGEHLGILRRPRLQNRRIQRPVHLHAVAMRKQCLISEHGIEQQPF